ncbi:hypothetical protein PIIN_00241 [Serendipita indica DSM 11827]|uniref:Uncharacterized protein n=1 Tax=Serendipita indica (strain DSM 11827) TaxID=1109443 RepID=G4T5F5_SERID|nr:hypothetical protein PIIN_00241 [Serendipita indica DSM 11827]
MDEKDTLSSPSSASTNTPTPPPAVTGNPMSLARERPDFKILFERDRQTWIQVFIGKQGCITGAQLDSALKNASAIFGLVVPSNNDALSPSPTPPTRNAPLPSTTMPPPMSALSSSLLTTTMSSQQQQQQTQSQPLLNLPELFPPPPFTPSHPLFVNLAKDAKKASKAARDAAEAEIAQYIEAKRRELIEYEANLKRQTNAIWRTWRDSVNNDQQLPLSIPPTPNTSEPVAPPMDPRKQPKRLSSSASTSKTTSRAATVIRSFQEEPVDASQQAANSIEASSVSPSNATPRPHPQMSALGTSLRQTAMLYPSGRRAASPSPPIEQDNGTFESAFMDNFEGDRPSKKIHTKEKARREPGLDDDLSLSPKKPRPSAMKRVSIGGAQSIDGESPESTDADGGTSGGGSKRKAVKFSSDAPDVVTVTREIKSEKLQKIKEEHARGEEAIFDLDGDEHDEPKPPSSPEPVPERGANLVEERGQASTQEPRPVTLSFKLPSYLDNGRPSRKIEYTMARSLPATSVLSSMKGRDSEEVGSLGLDINSSSLARTRKAKHGESSSQSPYAGELRRIMAAQTPTHRSAWRTGSFEPGSRMGGGSRSRGVNGYTSRTAALKRDSDDNASSDEESDDDTLDMTGRQRDASNDSDRRTREDVILSASVPMDVPRMRRVGEQPAMADHDFEGAMARSVDPGPALELMVAERQANRRLTREDEEDSDQDLDSDRRGLARRSRRDEEEDEEGDAEAKKLMQEMIEGRGSLHAQRILSHTDRGSMWRSLA